MDVNLLRAKMAIVGDTKAIDLAQVLGMNYQNVYRRLRGDVPFHTDEIKKIASHYHLTPEETVKIFDLGG